MPFSADVQKGLIAGAFGLVGTLIPAILSWSHDRMPLRQERGRLRTQQRGWHSGTVA